MFGQWLLPYNEIVAQWVDPFYDAGADSHTSIMGNIGGSTERSGGWLSSLFYNGSFNNSSDFTNAFGALAFNRRQEGVVQYVWPNTSAMASQTRDGLQFRFAVTSGDGIEAQGVDSESPLGGRDVDPRIISTGVSYQHNMANGQIWLAAAYEQHEDVSAVNLSYSGEAEVGDIACDDSDDEGYRLAGRYKHDWGNGQSTWIAAMYEELEYDASCQRVTAVDANGKPTTSADYNNTNAPIWSGVDRDAWMISGKHAFGNGVDIRASYMDADEWDCDSDVCTSAAERDTDADAFNIGVFYTMPAGTELRATYSEVDNKDNAGYDFGINGTVPATGADIEMFAVGIVHWFD
ncbi:MAG: porin [Chromatiales bacterium]|nr:porin [Chromatiales bacterium]